MKNQQLPFGWDCCRLGDILQPSKERVDPNSIDETAYIGLEHIEKDTGKLLGHGNSSEVRSSKTKFFEGDLLYGKLRPYLNKVHVASFAGVCSTDILVFPKNKYVSNKYLLFRFLQPDFVRFANLNVSGVQHPRVNFKKLADFVIPIAPLPEQQRIIARIEELFSHLDVGIEALQRAKAQLQRYRQAVLKAAVEGRLTEEWRRAHTEVEPAEKLHEKISNGMQVKARRDRNKSHLLNINELPQLPERWTWSSLSQIGELNRGISKHRPRDDPKLYGGPYPFIQTGDVRHASGILESYSQTYSEEGLMQSRLWPKGTLLITIAANIADTAILGFDACFPDSIVGFLTDPEKCNIHFVELFIRTAKDDIERYAPATAQKNINLRILSELAVPFPPLEEQNFIVKTVEFILSIIYETEKFIEMNLNKVGHLRQSILAQAFKGNLMHQDPNDESAITLLEQIKKGISESRHTKKIRKREKKGVYRMRRSLYEVLSEADAQVTTEELFSKSDHSVDSIDEFYEELREEISIKSRIEEIRPNKCDVYLKVISNENI